MLCNFVLEQVVVVVIDVIVMQHYADLVFVI